MGQWRSRGRSAITLHIYEYKGIMQAIDMTLVTVILSAWFGARQKWGSKSLKLRRLPFLDLELLRAY